MLSFKNDSSRLVDELDELLQQNPQLHSLSSDLADFIAQNFKKDLVITMIARTDVEQAEIYKNSEKYKAKPFKSPHQFYHAIDIRSSTFTAEEIKQIEDYVNTKYNNSNYYKWTARNHIVPGGAYHFHIQYVEK